MKRCRFNYYPLMWGGSCRTAALARKLCCQQSRSFNPPLTLNLLSTNTLTRLDTVSPSRSFSCPINSAKRCFSCRPACRLSPNNHIAKQPAATFEDATTTADDDDSHVAAQKMTCSLAADNCEVFVMTSESGMTWIDVRGFQDDTTIETDADFVAAARRVLRKHGVPDHFISEVRSQFALPTTLRADGGRVSGTNNTFCFVTRFALREEERGMQISGDTTPRPRPDEIAYPVSSLVDHFNGDEGCSGAVPGSTRGSGVKRGMTITRANVGGTAQRRREIQEHLEKELKNARENKENATGHYLFGKRKRKHQTGHSKSSQLALHEASESLYDLTGRLTIIVLKEQNKLITIHRQRMPSLMQMRRQWVPYFKTKPMDDLILHMARACATTFLEASRDKGYAVDSLEGLLFASDHSNFGEYAIVIRKLHGLNRAASVFCRILTPMEKAFKDTLDELNMSHVHDARAADTLQTMRRARHSCDELREQILSLLSLHFSVVSYQIEELMRVMTIFSTVFIPLTFVAGLFGMNFYGLGVVVSEDHGILWCGMLMAFSGAMTVVWLRYQKFW